LALSLVTDTLSVTMNNVTDEASVMNKEFMRVVNSCPLEFLSSIEGKNQ
jgi:hypothetical protein